MGAGSANPEVVQWKTIWCPGDPLPVHELPGAGSARSTNAEARAPGNTKVPSSHSLALHVGDGHRMTTPTATRRG